MVAGGEIEREMASGFNERESGLTERDEVKRESRRWR